MFDEIPRRAAPSATAVAADKVAMRSTTFPTPRKGQRRAGLRIFIGAAVMKRLGWKTDQAVKILWGRDIDHGKVKVAAIEAERLGWTLRPDKRRTAWKLATAALPAVDAEPPALQRAEKDWPHQVIGHEVNDAAKPAELVLYLPPGYLVKPAMKAVAGGRR